MVFSGGNSGLGRTYVVDVPNWAWTRLADTLYNREDSSCGCVRHYILASGGRGLASGNTEVLSSLGAGTTWYQIATVPSLRGNFMLSPHIYQMEHTFTVLGGTSGNGSVQNDVWEFNYKHFQWEMSDLPKLEVARSSHVVIGVTEEAVCVD